MGVSGEFRYFGCWSASIARPPKATTDPLSRQIGIISRPRNRSTVWPSSRCDDEAALRPGAAGRTPGEGALTSARRARAARSRGRAARPSRGRCRAPSAAAARASRPPTPAAAGTTPAAASWILSSVSRSTLSVSSPPLASGTVIPNRRATSRTASWNPDLLLQFDELEHVAAGLAPEAVEEALVRVDVERRRLLAVERAESLPRRPGLLQRDVVLHHLDDVRPGRAGRR